MTCIAPSQSHASLLTFNSSLLLTAGGQTVFSRSAARLKSMAERASDAHAVTATAPEVTSALDAARCSG